MFFTDKRSMAIIKLSTAERRKLTAFFSCLVLAFMAWIVVTMSNNYTFSVKAALDYKNQPVKRAFRALQADTVNAIVGGTGWKRLFSAFTLHERDISVDLRKLETQNFVVLSNQLPQINQHFNKNQQIISFNPDTIYFDFTSRKVKKVPIVLRSSIGYQQQYARAGDISVKPDYVTISGPTAYIDTVKNWKTDSLVLRNASKDIVSDLKLVRPPENNVAIYPKSVEVNIPVDEFTEKTLEIPIKLINNKSFGRVTLFPKKVKVTFMVSLTNFAAINADFFEAVADLSDWENKGLEMLPVKLKQQPDYCKIVRIQPTSVSFILRK